MRAIGYCRVSTDKQLEGVSIDNQKQRIQQYCEYKEFHLAEIIEDLGVSGGLNKSRQGFMQVLDMVESCEIEVIVLYSLERLSRNMLTMLAVERLLEEFSIQLHTIEGMIDTSTPEGFMSFAMKAFLGEMERRTIKYRTRKALEHKKLNGQVTGQVPYGFARIGKDLVPIEEEQWVIKLVNGFYQTGMRIADIQRALKEGAAISCQR